MDGSQFAWRAGAARAETGVFDEGLRRHMLRIYNAMGLGLVMTGLVAWIVAATPALHGPIFGTPLKWVVMLAPLGFALFFSFRLHALSAGAAQALYWAFCALMGLSLASVFLVFTGESVARTFFIAAIMFAATSLYGYTARQDLSRFGSFLMMGLIGVVVAGLVNAFIGSSTLQFVVSVIGIIVFVGLTAWDTQSIKQRYAEHAGHEPEGKLAVLGALSLYLNFVNLFQLLLHFTGQRDE